jgi:hypothetical protein
MLAEWLDTEPEVPPDNWFKRFPRNDSLRGSSKTAAVWPSFRANLRLLATMVSEKIPQE